MKGYAGVFLRVNLSKKRIDREPLKESLAEKYIGGKGFAAKILLDELKKGVDPLSPENKLLFMTGPLNGTSVPSTRISVATKSVLTDTFTDSYVGGFLGPTLKWAGYDGIIIEGRSEEPVILRIDDENVDLVDAKNIWGKNTLETEQELKKGYYTGYRVACIGRAGENLVKYAMINTEFWRQAGRGGVGAVMGSKKLKAVVIKGNKQVEVDDSKAMREESKKLIEKQRDAGFSKNMRSLGTGSSVMMSSDNSLFPTRNFQSESFEGAETISAEYAKKNFWTKNEACYNCNIACGHIGTVKSGKFEGSEVNGPEYETCAMMGANCGLSDLDALAHVNMLVDDYGLDSISAGNVIAFVMELYQRGILSKQDLGGIEATWGNADAMVALIKAIAERKGIGDVLANGVKRASEAIGKGSEKYAMQAKGLEIPGWGARGAPSMGLNYATATSGPSHCRAWMIGHDMGWANAPDGRKLERYSIVDKADSVKWVQDKNCMEDSLVVCSFASTAVFYASYVPLLKAATGFDLTLDEHLKIGERIWNTTKLFNVREGFTDKDDTLPARFFDEPLPSGAAKGRKLDREEFKAALGRYYNLRGWDERGMPTKAKLAELGVD